MEPAESGQGWTRRPLRPGELAVSGSGCSAQQGRRQPGLAFGTVVFAAVPFWDGTPGTKRRPAVIVRHDDRGVVICPITSSSGYNRPIGAYPRLVFWRDGGLARPSFLVPHLVVIDRSAVLHVWGRLHDQDLQMLRGLNLSSGPHPGQEG